VPITDSELMPGGPKALIVVANLSILRLSVAARLASQSQMPAVDFFRFAECAMGFSFVAKA